MPSLFTFFFCLFQMISHIFTLSYLVNDIFFSMQKNVKLHLNFNPLKLTFFKLMQRTDYISNQMKIHATNQNWWISISRNGKMLRESKKIEKPNKAVKWKEHHWFWTKFKWKKFSEKYKTHKNVCINATVVRSPCG